MLRREGGNASWLDDGAGYAEFWMRASAWDALSRETQCI